MGSSALHVIPDLNAFCLGFQKLTITPDRGSTINIRSIQSKGCNLCTGSGRSRQCHTALLLKANTPVSVEFECTRPEDVLKVEIVRNIGKAL